MNGLRPMKPTLVVGDLHGKHEVVTAVLEEARDNDFNVVFIGDYLDSYTRGSDDCVTTLLLVLDAIENNPEQVTALWGNHEKSYVDAVMRCSGFDTETYPKIQHLEDRMNVLLKDYVWVYGYLLSHAGVSAALLRNLKIDLPTYLESKNNNQIGFARGGNHRVGGLYWCDFRREFEPIDGVPQITGHTRGTGIRQKGNSYCIDCLEDRDDILCVLLTDDGAIQEYSI